MTRIHSIGYLAEMMGDETTVEQAEAMRDLLVADGLLDWSDGQGMMSEVGDDRWFALLVTACEQGQ
jgi:hypothetical protein